MKVLCLIPDLESGGAQRVMTWLSEGLGRRGHQVTLVCLSSDEERPTYRRPTGVEVVHLGINSVSGSVWEALRANWRRIRTVRRMYVLKQPDVVLSFLDTTNVLALGAALGTGWPVVVSEHTDPARSSIGSAWSIGRQVLYYRARAIVLLAEGMRESFGSGLQGSIRILPNPVVVSPGDQVDSPPAGRKRLLAVGRLDPVKGFDRLIDAFASMASRFETWDLAILGEGRERGTLEEQVARLGLGNRIRLLGERQDPFPVYRGSDAFVLSSHREGFPMVLVEAMACGLPAVATNCSPAITEILEGGRSGLIVSEQSQADISQGLNRLLDDRELREAFGRAAPAVASRFAPEAVLDRWEQLLSEARR
jgi:GalNAc-alpha-(1->4)-GalNAc-alpha-(1->3)-diNAcBac-PP-undecaprenol alpha-1,4-N-acetyl-D-galactosaminyltransferase